MTKAIHLKIMKNILVIIYIGYLLAHSFLEVNPILSKVWIGLVLVLFGVKFYFQPAKTISNTQLIILILSLLVGAYISFIHILQ